MLAEHIGNFLFVIIKAEQRRLSMNKMKLLICAIFSLILAIGLTACGSEEEDTTTQEIEPVPEEGIMGEEGTTEPQEEQMEDTTPTEGTTEMGEPTQTEGTTVEESLEEETGTTEMGEPTQTEGTTVEESLEEETEQP